jgi:septation ring formation regulator EzrA
LKNKVSSQLSVNYYITNWHLAEYLSFRAKLDFFKNHVNLILKNAETTMNYSEIEKKLKKAGCYWVRDGKHPW